VSYPSTNTIIISVFFLCLFISNGAIVPFFSLYLKELKFSGTQIGMIVSIGPLMMLLVQPIWGYICDTTKKFHLILVVTILITAAIGLLFPIATGFGMFLILSILLAMFQGAIDPVSTSLIMSHIQKHNLQFGKYRLWGAVGFALSIWAIGQLSEIYSLEIIFYTFSLFLLLTAILAWNLPSNISTTHIKITGSNRFKKLFTQTHYLIFLIASFLVHGVMMANNAFYGFLFESIGGTLAGVGFSFLISVGSEVPFMRITGKLMDRLGIISVLILASFVSSVQYFCFYFQPSEAWVYVLNVAQGFSIGIIIPASFQYVQKYTPNSLQTTAMGIFSGVGYGLGNWFFTMIGGILLDFTNIHSVYLLFSIVSFLGMFIFIGLHYSQRKLATGLSYES
jgi:PPP family 3-phenylpropionic acid transporter